MSVHSQLARGGVLRRLRHGSAAPVWALALFAWGTLGAPLVHNADHAGQHGHHHALWNETASASGFDDARDRLSRILGRGAPEPAARPPARPFPTHGHDHGPWGHQHAGAADAPPQQQPATPEAPHDDSGIEHLGVAIGAGVVFTLPDPHRPLEAAARPIPPDAPASHGLERLPSPRAPPQARPT